MFIQNVTLVARGEGLHTCTQAAFASYHRIIRRHLPIPDDEIILCGMAVVCRDPEAPENIWRIVREPVASFTQWFGIR